jgi:hypothetical protein
MLLYDTALVGAELPQDPEAVAGYVDGAFRTFDDLVARYPNARHVSITVEGDLDAMVLDWERGNADPPDWAQRKIARGERPIIYCQVSNAPHVAKAIAPLRLGVAGEVDWFAADWTGAPHLQPASVATQFANGPHYDVSMTAPDWPPADTSAHEPPAPGPAPAPPAPVPAPPEPAPPAPVPPAQPAPEVDVNVPELSNRTPEQTGGWVRIVQTVVGAPPDGVFGPVTEGYVKRWQAQHGLAVDGVVGPATAQAIVDAG